MIFNIDKLWNLLLGIFVMGLILIVSCLIIAFIYAVIKSVLNLGKKE